MRTITFDTGYIVAQNEDAASFIYALIENDSFWEYISVLITRDLETKELSTEKRLASIESMLKDIKSKMETNPNAVQIVSEPLKKEPVKPDAPKKVKKTKVSGKGSKGFLAAAQKASSFR